MLCGELRRVGRADAPLSPRTVNYMLTAVTSALRAALRRRLVAVTWANASSGSSAARTPARSGVGWRAEQVRAFLAHVRGHLLYAAFPRFSCGLRRGEVLGLRQPAVVLTGGTPALTVRWNRVQVGNQVHGHGPKSRASRRTLPLPEPVSVELAGLLMRQRRERTTAGPAYRPDCPRCGQVHVVVDGLGRPYRPEWYSDEPRVPLHGVRHTAASLLGSLGVLILHVAAWLGQSQLSVTAGYQHAGAAGLAEVARRFSEVLSPQWCETSVRDDLSGPGSGGPGHYRSCS